MLLEVNGKEDWTLEGENRDRKSGMKRTVDNDVGNDRERLRRREG